MALVPVGFVIKKTVKGSNSYRKEFIDNASNMKRLDLQNGVDKALIHFSEIAGKHSMTVLMANCIGHCDNFESVGKTSIWNNKGNLVGQFNDKIEGIIIYDTKTQEIITKTL